jgi:hypothetical protein
VADFETCPDPVIEESSDPFDERDRIDRTREWVKDDEKRIRNLLGPLEDAALYVKIRFVRALDGLLPAAGTSFNDWLISSDDLYCYYLFETLERPLAESTFHELKSFVDHDVQWVAGAVFAALGSSYDRDPGFLRSALRDERRKPVLVRALKTLYDQQAEGLSDLLQEFVQREYSDQVRFYAAVLLKMTDPSVLETLSTNDDYLKKILKSVPVTSDAEKAI